MSVYDFAVKMEIEAEAYYRDLAQKAQNQGIRNILNWLADEEVRHRNVFEAMDRNDDVKLDVTQLLGDAKEAFAGIKHADNALRSDMEQLALYTKARQTEDDARQLYIKKAAETDNVWHKDALLKIAEEEKKHYILLDNVVEMLSRPEEWLENAEFNNMEEF